MVFGIIYQGGIPFKAHWGKINFMDPQFVHDHFESCFQPFIRPMSLNSYLTERLNPAPSTPNASQA